MGNSVRAVLVFVAAVAALLIPVLIEQGYVRCNIYVLPCLAVLSFFAVVTFGLSFVRSLSYVREIVEVSGFFGGILLLFAFASLIVLVGGLAWWGCSSNIHHIASSCAPRPVESRVQSPSPAFAPKVHGGSIGQVPPARTVAPRRKVLSPAPSVSANSGGVAVGRDLNQSNNAPCSANSVTGNNTLNCQLEPNPYKPVISYSVDGWKRTVSASENRLDTSLSAKFEDFRLLEGEQEWERQLSEAEEVRKTEPGWFTLDAVEGDAYFFLCDKAESIRLNEKFLAESAQAPEYEKLRTEIRVQLGYLANPGYLEGCLAHKAQRKSRVLP